MQLCNMLFVVVVVFRKVFCKSNDILKIKNQVFFYLHDVKKLCINPLHLCKKENMLCIEKKLERLFTYFFQSSYSLEKTRSQIKSHECFIIENT